MRLKMLKSTLPILDTTRGIRMIDDVIRENKRKAKRSGAKADPRRVLALDGAAWRKLRAQVLAGEPLCRHHAERGLTEPATDVDHIDGDSSNNSLDNLQPLCHSCHSTKTNVDKGHSVRTGHGIDGLPLSGEWAK